MTAAEHSPEAVRRALWENDRAPNGLLRNARAEELVAAAEATGDRDLLRHALFGVIRAYEYSTERGRMLVPFARLLQEWDRDPSAFDSGDTHTFHWMFKWVSSGMLTLPEVPLATMEQWLAEMERRYRTAGYTERAVRQAEFELADDTGDTGRAARAFAAWTAADRDPMANCHACELNDQGSYWLSRGDDDKALRTWAPVLDGTKSCMEEPHRVLAESLLPLVRTGRVDQARANHLRGYRMVRGNESLLPSTGLHIEFCALTGNEARGLELLAEHASHLASDGNPWARLHLLTGTLVLLRRLLALDTGDQPAVPYAGRQCTVRDLHDLLDAEAAAIAARFDARNGSTVVSGRLKARLEQGPLLAALPLGVRAARPVPAVAAPVPATAPGPVREDGAALPDLVAEARRLRTDGHPRADVVWERVAALVARSGATPDPLLAADLLDQRALAAGRADDASARELFERVAAAYRAAGAPGRAVLAELRAATAAIRAGAEPEEARALLATAAASAEALDPADPVRIRRVAAAALLRAKLEAMLDHDADDHGAARLDAGLAAFEERFAPYPDAPGDGVEDLLAEADETRADLAWRAGDPATADELLTRAARRTLAAGHPWEAVAPLTTRARLLLRVGRAAEAEESAREAYAYGAELTAPHELAGVRLTLAEALYAQDGKEAEAAGYALEAAHWYDAAGDSAGAGAYARLVLAESLGEAGRSAEAAEVLESALPDLLEHGDEQAVRARDVLARNLRALGDHRAAAEQYLLAAEVARGWDHQGAHAQLATLAAECLAQTGGLRDEAVAAYHRAVELWAAVGDPAPLARALRSAAWLEAGRGDREAARELMARALAAVEGEEPVLLAERAHTWAQTARLLLDGLDEDAEDDAGGGGGESAGAVRREAVDLLRRAEEAFAALGPDAVGERVRCAVHAAWLDRDLGRAPEATTRLRALVAELDTVDTEEARQVLTRLRRALDAFVRED
ncbi:tetratricopeptide repeat protein [Streptomyces sp. TRM76323]|uniref:Tetratricopeptide repeat protein n=1 Tax=Streptomyces tamarix TaxID=3078565 RepID=A0ABU3QUD6_9ACTN|nr:tetratricopeptide repeat protein [Streptomyces tamarix]MDT9685972.1 tetratricopeptide repeat protein [Streptomyces tamarix]